MGAVNMAEGTGLSGESLSNRRTIIFTGFFVSFYILSLILCSMALWMHSWMEHTKASFFADLFIFNTGSGRFGWFLGV